MEQTIEAKDLRIGNLYWVLHEESEEVKSVDLKMLQGLIDYEDDPDGDRWSRGGPPDYYAAIPLTEEWLLKFGFEKNPKALDYGFDDWVYPGKLHFKVGMFNGEGYLLDAYDSMPKMKFVHQLQNLFYALTGQELEIKTPVGHGI